MLIGLIPTIMGLFCVTAAALDWEWFCGHMTRCSPLSLLLPRVVVRAIVRFIAAVLGTMTAAIGVMGLMGVVH
ncbi:MAG TPA: hypothetical protein DDY78_27770 [Planctomycetales bacterium]|jgi:hypothetical protein|nr:hypothetical protein [Planctomycetales bacterium]